MAYCQGLMAGRDVRVRNGVKSRDSSRARAVVVRQLPACVVSPDHSIPFLPLPFTSTMSDSDGDFSDELLELAGATEKKRKRREGSSKSGAKRRKAE